MTVGQVRAPPTPHHPHHIPKDRWVPTRDLARVHRKWGQHAGWHRGSRSKVPKPVPAYLHRQKEILAPPETTSPPTQSSTSSRKPSCSTCTAPGPVADCEPSAPSPLPPDPGGRPGPCLQDYRGFAEESLAGNGGGCTFHRLTHPHPRWPQAMLPLADLWGQEAKATISRHLAAKGLQVSCERTPEGTLRSSGRPHGSQLCPRVAGWGRASRGGGSPRAPPTPRAAKLLESNRPTVPLGGPRHQESSQDTFQEVDDPDRAEFCAADRGVGCSRDHRMAGRHGAL